MRDITRRQAEGELAQRASAFSCERWRQEDEPFQFGAIGAIWCDQPAPAVRQLALFLFPDPAEMEAFWPIRVAAIDPPVSESETACQAGEQGSTSWGFGGIACYVQRGVAKIRWTDERSGIYGVIDASDRDLEALYTWWRRNGRQLGQPLATPTPSPSEEPA